jgi:hypothetical protein
MLCLRFATCVFGLLEYYVYSYSYCTVSCFAHVLLMSLSYMCTFAFWCHISTYLADECFAICIQTVLPKQGRALLWPSVKNDLPNLKDHRTDHQALPVEAGIKYGTFMYSLIVLSGIFSNGFLSFFFNRCQCMGTHA